MPICHKTENKNLLVILSLMKLAKLKMARIHYYTVELKPKRNQLKTQSDFTTTG